MDISKLVQAILAGDLLAARQFVADALRTDVEWSRLEQPLDLNEREMSVAAGLIELFASRTASNPPVWTKTVGPVRELLVLDPGLEQMPRSFAHARIAGPAPLLKRNMVASPDFLDLA